MRRADAFGHRLDDVAAVAGTHGADREQTRVGTGELCVGVDVSACVEQRRRHEVGVRYPADEWKDARAFEFAVRPRLDVRSEEHTSELQSLMRISYAVFC